jgi:glycosyltransferase involved in cell wall biosynthesis
MGSTTQRSVRVGLIAYEMEGHRTGVGRFLEGLLDGLSECDRNWQWLLFFKGQPFRHRLWADGGNISPVFGDRPCSRPILWEQVRLPSLLRQNELDLLFSPGYSLPVRSDLPSVVTIHDLSFEELPQDFSWRERWRRRILARIAVRRARRVLAGTHEIAHRLQRTYRIEAERIGVVPLGVDRAFLRVGSESQGASLAQLARLGVQPPYLMYAGTILGRRRVDLVIGTFARLAPRYPELKLVLAGANRLRRPSQLEGWIRDSGAAHRVLRLGYVDEEVLPALYRHAQLTFYLSRHEGFGLPPLESLAAGTPSVVSGGMGLDEIWPDYPLRCERLEPTALERLTEGVLTDSEERRRIASEGAERMSLITWKRSAAEFLAELDRVVSQ